MNRDYLLLIGFMLGFVGGIVIGHSPINSTPAWFGSGFAFVGFCLALFSRDLARNK